MFDYLKLFFYSALSIMQIEYQQSLYVYLHTSLVCKSLEFYMWNCNGFMYVYIKLYDKIMFLLLA